MTGSVPPAPSANSQLLVRLVPKVGAALAAWRVERHEERLELFLGRSFGNVQPERVVAAIEEIPGFGDDLEAAVQAAVASTSDDKIELLARVLRAELTAKDQAAVDNAQQMLRVAIELEPVDVRALVVIGQDPHIDPMSTLQNELRVNEATAYAIRSRLLRLGLVENSTEAAVASPGDKHDDQVWVEESWGTTPVFDAVMLMLERNFTGP